jgi:transcription antitermination protein NusB
MNANNADDPNGRDIKPEGSRHQSREMAMQLLFQREFLPKSVAIPHLDLIQRFVDSFKVSAGVANYASQVYLGIVEHEEKVDARVKRASSNWKLDRMASVDRTILRIAVYEMCEMQPPLDAKIAINEAIELAKKYGGEDTASFVNGVLDQIANASGLGGMNR